MRTRLGILFAILAAVTPLHAKAKQWGEKKQHHALVRVALVAVKPFSSTEKIIVHGGKAIVTAPAHPKRTAKQILGSALFAIETGVDGARLGLEGADRAFEALSIKGKVPVLDQVYAFVDVGAKDAGKADRWIERQEQFLFGTHN